MRLAIALRDLGPPARDARPLGCASTAAGAAAARAKKLACRGAGSLARVERLCLGVQRVGHPLEVRREVDALRGLQPGDQVRASEPCAQVAGRKWCGLLAP